MLEFLFRRNNFDGNFVEKVVFPTKRFATTGFVENGFSDGIQGVSDGIFSSKMACFLVVSAMMFRAARPLSMVTGREIFPSGYDSEPLNTDTGKGTGVGCLASNFSWLNAPRKRIFAPLPLSTRVRQTLWLAMPVTIISGSS